MKIKTLIVIGVILWVLSNIFPIIGTILNIVAFLLLLVLAIKYSNK